LKNSPLLDLVIRIIGSTTTIHSWNK